MVESTSDWNALMGGMRSSWSRSCARAIAFSSARVSAQIWLPAFTGKELYL